MDFTTVKLRIFYAVMEAFQVFCVGFAITAILGTIYLWRVN